MMKQVLLSLFLLMGLQVYGQQLFQLAPPLLKYGSVFFEGSTSVEIRFNQPGAEVRYTLNGKEPTSNDVVYTKPVRIAKQATLKAKAFGKSFLPSETVQARFIKNGKKITEIVFSIPSEQYSSTRKDILFDNKGGLLNIHNGSWLGYNTDTVTIMIRLQQKEKITSVLLNMLQDEASWIFLPEQTLLYYFNEKQHAFEPVAKELLTFDKQTTKAIVSKTIGFQQPVYTDQLKLVLLPLKNIPAWHPGKGNHGWLFIDEIKVF
jgi:Chitobiase/beta-hexosaminidase C-terminal domain